jgi:hypothetical protein
MKQHFGKTKKRIARRRTRVLLVPCHDLVFRASALAAPKSPSDTETPGNSGNAHADKGTQSPTVTR